MSEHNLATAASSDFHILFLGWKKLKCLDDVPGGLGMFSIKSVRRILMVVMHRTDFWVTAQSENSRRERRSVLVSPKQIVSFWGWEVRSKR